MQLGFIQQIVTFTEIYGLFIIGWAVCGTCGVRACWNLLGIVHTVVLKARVRRRPQDRTFWKAHVCVRVVPNQSTPRVRILFDQSDRAGDLHI